MIRQAVTCYTTPVFIYGESCVGVEGYMHCSPYLVSVIYAEVCDGGGGSDDDGGYSPPRGGGGEAGETPVTPTVPPTSEDIENQIEDKPFALFGDVDCETLKKWLAVAKFTPGQAIIDRLNSLNPSVFNNNGSLNNQIAWIQKIDDAHSTVVNMDYFPVTVSELPIVNGQRLTAGQFLHYIRTNLDSFTDGSKTFSAYNANGIDDRNQWNSNNPIGSIVAIDMPGPDNGSVITSSSSTNKWTFTTIHEPMYANHPVSGNRDFGYVLNSNGSYTFYTQGVDRLTSWDGDLLQTAPDFFVEGSGIPFNAADNLWESLQNGIKNFVASHSGSAQINSPEILRPNWNIVKEVLQGKKPLSTLAKNCPD